MHLPSFHLRKRDDHARKQLAAWLAERDIDLALADETTGSAALARVRYLRTLAPPERTWEGDIVLLRPAATGSWGPVYLLLIEVVGIEVWRAIPFGRYATPAVPGEWQTPFHATPLRVLCCWNAREVNRSQWLPGLVKHCPAEPLERIKRVDRHVFSGAPFPPRDAVHLGPPLIHPADPRHDYLEEERLRLDAHLLARESAEVAEAADEPIAFDLNAWKKPEWKLAAEGRPAYGEGRGKVD